MVQLKHIFSEIHFEIVRVIAEGGMGTSYEAEQNGAGGFVKRVAIKLIREEYSKIDEFRNNFSGEARLVADLIHTNIVQTYHLGEGYGPTNEKLAANMSDLFDETSGHEAGIRRSKGTTPGLEHE